MNIHLRATIRLLKTITLPALVGAVIGIGFNMMTAEQIIISLAVGLIVFMFWLFYNWTLDQIKQEDILKHMENRKNLTNNT